MRLTKSAKQILQTAASAMHRSVSEFVLERAFEAPPRPSRRLAKLLKEPSVFERGGVK